MIKEKRRSCFDRTHCSPLLLDQTFALASILQQADANTHVKPMKLRHASTDRRAAAVLFTVLALIVLSALLLWQGAGAHLRLALVLTLLAAWVLWLERVGWLVRVPNRARACVRLAWRMRGRLGAATLGTLGVFWLNRADVRAALSADTEMLLFLLSLAVAWMAIWPLPAVWAWRRALRSGVLRWLAALTVWALVVRLWALDGLPWPMAEAEGELALRALLLRMGEVDSPFAVGWLGMPHLLAWWQSLFVGWLGPTMLAARLPVVLLGVWLVPLVFAFTRDLLDDLPAAWTAAALWAVWPLAVHYTRIGTPEVLDLLFGLGGVWALMRGLRQRQVAWWALAGLLLGLGLAFTLAARLFLVLALGWLVLTWWLHPREWGGQWGGLSVALWMGWLAASPFAAEQGWGAALWRPAYRMDVFATGWLAIVAAGEGMSQMALLARQAREALLGFIARPDRDRLFGWWAPLLDVPTRLALLMGVGAWWAEGARRRTWWFVGWLVLGVAYAALFPDPPASTKLLPLAPLVVMCVAWGVWASVRLLPLTAWERFAWVALFVLVVSGWSLYTYGQRYATQGRFDIPTMQTATVLGQWLAEQSDRPFVYFWGEPFLFFENPVLQYLGHRPRGMTTSETGDFSFVRERPAVLVFLPERRQALDAFLAQHPQTTPQAAYAPDGRLLYWWIWLDEETGGEE